jgi:hypothetical protein
MDVAANRPSIFAKLNLKVYGEILVISAPEFFFKPRRRPLNPLNRRETTR